MMNRKFLLAQQLDNTRAIALDRNRDLRRLRQMPEDAQMYLASYVWRERIPVLHVKMTLQERLKIAAFGKSSNLA